jgi:hypothetical protein
MLGFLDFAWNDIRFNELTRRTHSTFAVRDSKSGNAFAMEANPVSSGVGRSSPCGKADPIVLSKSLPLSRPARWRAIELS